ncbi:MAG: hypothetical protein KGH79_02245 [Patescibacteria group bacterium]|nr:hypothetical protein [Patescibacteria group bacterium]
MKKRPAWVWIISAYYLVTLISSVFFVISLGNSQQLVGPLNPISQILISINLSINAGAAVTFFLLKKISIPLMIIALVLGIIGTLVNLFTTNLIQVIGWFGLVGIIGYIPPILIVLYAKHLAKKAMLT